MSLATGYEAYDRTADGAGAFLTMAVNGIGALRVPGLDRLAARHGFDTPIIDFRNGAGRRLGRRPVARTAPTGGSAR